MIRVVDSGVARPQFTAAVDEALLESVLSGGGGDTIHLYRRRPPSVSIGYFQAAEEVADMDACRRDGVPVVRRVSGGGAIYTDERQLVYALVTRPGHRMSAREGFSMACSALVMALARIGVADARISGVNDVVVGDAKVSGSAQVIRRGAHLIHGTLLVDADLGAMFTYLRPLPPKLEAAGLPAPRARVTNLAELLGEAPDMERVKGAVAEELASALGDEGEAGTLSREEEVAARDLVANRYGQDGWNLRR